MMEVLIWRVPRVGPSVPAGGVEGGRVVAAGGDGGAGEARGQREVLRWNREIFHHYQRWADSL